MIRAETIQALSIFSGYFDGENSLDQLHFHVTENEVLRRTSTRIQTMDSAIEQNIQSVTSSQSRYYATNLIVHEMLSHPTRSALHFGDCACSSAVLIEFPLDNNGLVPHRLILARLLQDICISVNSHIGHPF